MREILCNLPNGKRSAAMAEYVEKTVKKNYVYKGKILSLRVDDALLPNGKPCVREIVEHSGGACALYVENDKAVFVRQYRYAYGESVLELPAGKCDAGEDPAIAAARELAEETGIVAKKVSLLFEIYPSPGYTDEKIYVYLAEDGKMQPQKLDEGEFLDVVWLPLATVKEMLSRGEFKDAKTIIALQTYLLREHGSFEKQK